MGEDDPAPGPALARGTRTLLPAEDQLPSRSRPAAGPRPSRASTQQVLSGAERTTPLRANFPLPTGSQGPGVPGPPLSSS